MHLRRAVLGLISSATWPAVVVCLPLGITFFSARVFAESGAISVEECDASAVVSCADAGELAYCSSERCTGSSCACVSGAICLGDSTPVRSCREVITCDQYMVAPCAGKALGEACTTTDERPAAGTCTTITCAAPGDGGFVSAPALACQKSPAASSSAPVAEDSGCTASRGMVGGSVTIIGLPVAVGLLLARRRRRS